MASARVRELLTLLADLLQELATQEAPAPRPAPPPDEVRPGEVITEADLARGFTPHGAVRQRTFDARWLLDRQR